MLVPAKLFGVSHKVLSESFESLHSERERLSESEQIHNHR